MRFGLTTNDISVEIIVATSATLRWHEAHTRPPHSLLNHSDTTVDPAAYGKIARCSSRRRMDEQLALVAAGAKYRPPRPATFMAMCLPRRPGMELGNPEQARHWFAAGPSTGHRETAPTRW